MNNKYNLKKYIIILLILIIVFLVIYYNFKKDDSIVIKTPTNELIDDYNTQNPLISLCYYSSTKVVSGLNDVAWLKLNTQGDIAKGEFDYISAEKDSKVGLFEGIIKKDDTQDQYSYANVWWNSKAEGMENREELIIKYNETTATAGFGEMIEGKGGVYLYKDKENLYYIDPMAKIACDDLSEKLFVEKYIKDNIKSIAKMTEPVLGGSWYVVSVNVDSKQNIARIVYEDGHIQNKAEVTYEYKNNSQSLVIIKFEIIP